MLVPTVYNAGHLIFVTQRVLFFYVSLMFDGCSMLTITFYPDVSIIQI